jgi:hypothetical protein
MTDKEKLETIKTFIKSDFADIDNESFSFRGALESILSIIERPSSPQPSGDLRERIPRGHKSDCAVHNMPAYPNGECNCGLESEVRSITIPLIV